MKTHPTSEEWISFLYREDVPAEHERLAGHLQQCEACRRQVDSWRQSMLALDDWRVPAAPRRTWLASPRVPWAAAAAAAVVLLAAGALLGRFPVGRSAGRLSPALLAYVDQQVGATRAEFARLL